METLDVESVLEQPPCPLCQSKQAHAVFEGQDDWVPDGKAGRRRFLVVRCEGCGAHYTTPRFRESKKQFAFSGSYPFYQRARQNSSDPTEMHLRPFDRRINLLERVHPQPGSILDLGMGDGLFLAAMRQRGWQTTGIDSEADVVTYARQRLGLSSSFVADAELDPFPEGMFNVVTMWGMLQLTYHPHQLLKKVKAVLVPDGVIAIGVANISGAGARLFGSHWHGLGLPRHLIHFDPNSLRRLVEETGFRIHAIEFDTPYWIIRPSVLASLPLPGILGGIVRRLVYSVLSLGGRTRLGDTMILIAKVER